MPDNISSTSLAQSQGYPGEIIQSAKLNDDNKPTQRSIKDANMARDVAKLIVAAGRNRSIVNSRILAKFNAERPYDSYKLESEGLGWRSNFTSKPLPAMIEKVAPRFSTAIKGLKYLTNSSLSTKWENSTEKTETFRECITNTIRGRKGWRTLVEDIAFNNALFGSSVVAWLDNFTWFPINFKMDEGFLPDGCKQESKFCQVAILKETLLPNELFTKIKDREAAEVNGFDVEQTRLAINEASSAQLRDLLNVGGTLEFWYQNAIRELTLGATYMAGAQVIIIYHVLAREVTGKVSHYQLAGTNMRCIFSKDDQFDGMDECLSFFSYQKGNGTMAGSKGVGRDIYELAGMIDRTRNEIVDRSILSGKTFVQGDIKRIHTFKMSIVGAMAIVPSGWNFLEQKIDGNIEPFLKLDAYFSMLVDGLIGNTSPPSIATSGEAFRSPAAWNLMAAREEEGKDFRIARFLEQFTDMVQTMQRRICDSETVDDDAKAAQAKLLELMTREELDELAQSPVAETVRDLTPQERQMISLVANEKRGNPLYNQHQLELEDLTARVNQDFANKVLLPDNDPTVQAENQRQQQLELGLLMQGAPVPVSPRDNHLIHMSVLMPTMDQVAGGITQGQTSTASFEASLAHLNEHYTRALQQGADKKALAEVGDFLKKAGATLAELKSLDQQQAQLAATAQQV